MKALCSLIFIGASLAWTQTAPPPPADPNTVIAIFEDGSKMTAGELQALVPVLPAQYQADAEQNPQSFLKVYAIFKKAAAAATSQKLGEKAPYKQGVDFAIMVALAQADFLESTAAIAVSPEELERYYNDHKEPFRRIKVSGIKVAFGGTSEPASSSTANSSRVPKKVLTEDEAKVKADKLVAQVRAGADFGKLVLLESDDETSKAKGGDLGVWGVADNVPDVLRAGVMGLKEGEVSEPIRQPGGFYIIHADAVTYAPLADVKDSIFTQLKQEKARKWFEELRNSTKVDFPKNDPPAPPAPSDPKK